MTFKDALPLWERIMYWIIGLTVMIKSLVELYSDSERHKNEFYYGYFLSGWKFIGRGKDHSDTEWVAFLTKLWPSLPWFIGHVLLSQACFFLRIKEKPRKLLLLFLDMLAVARIFGARMLLLLFIRVVLMFAISLLGSIWLIWTLAISLIYTLNNKFLLNSQLKFMGILEYDIASYNFVVLTAFFELRLISAAAEKIKFRQSQLQRILKWLRSIFQRKRDTSKKSENSNEVSEQSEDVTNSFKDQDPSKVSELVDSEPTLCDFMFFAFYLPVLGDGPILVYNRFHKDIRTCFTSSVYTIDVFDILKNFLRLFLWGVFIEFQLHFVYYCAVGQNLHVLEHMSIWSLDGLMYAYGQFFMLKYVCMYGKSCQFSRFDGIDPPKQPRCISWVYSFSEMWKAFDPGLHNFLTIYIFFPLGGSRRSLLRTVFNTAVVFSFIYFWHGTQYQVFVWSFGNYISGAIEVVGTRIEHSATGKYLKTILSPAMQLRLKAFLVTPMYIASSILLHCIFFSDYSAWVATQTLVLNASWFAIAMEYIGLMACMHNAMYLHMRLVTSKCQKSHQP